jgi:hypothetical protein
MFLGLLNLAAAAAPVARVWLLCRCANVLGVAFAGPAAIAIAEPKGYIALVFIAALAVGSFVRTPHSASPPTGGLGGPAAAATLFTIGAVAAGMQFAGCVADKHPWFQIATWAVIAPVFAWAALVSVRRLRRSVVARKA